MEKYFIGLDKMTLDELEVWRLLCRHSDYETNVAGYTERQLEINSDVRLGLTRQRIRTILKKFEKDGYIEFMEKGSKGKESTLRLCLKDKIFNEPTTIQPQSNHNATNKSEELQQVEGFVNHEPTTMQPQSNHTTKKKKKKKENDINQNDELLLKNFNLLWGLYPRKEGKQKAFTVYKKLIKKYNDDRIKDAIEVYRQEIQYYKTDAQYIKHGSTFFNCVEDDYIIPNKKTPFGEGANVNKNNNYSKSICNNQNKNTQEIREHKFV